MSRKGVRSRWTEILGHDAEISGHVGPKYPAGHVESTCVRDRGLAGSKDWQLMDFVVGGDFTLVTHNAVDFRGGGPGKLGGEHAKQAIHAGLVCLNSVHTLDLQRQLDLFQIALEQLDTMGDLVNQALEVFEEEDGSVAVVVYEIPDTR